MVTGCMDTNRTHRHINQPIVEDYMWEFLWHGSSAQFQSGNTNTGKQQLHLMLPNQSTKLSLLQCSITKTSYKMWGLKRMLWKLKKHFHHCISLFCDTTTSYNLCCTDQKSLGEEGKHSRQHLILCSNRIKKKTSEDSKIIALLCSC